jgi:hypothetical protein
VWVALAFTDTDDGHPSILDEFVKSHFERRLQLDTQVTRLGDLLFFVAHRDSVPGQMHPR